MFFISISLLFNKVAHSIVFTHCHFIKCLSCSIFISKISQLLVFASTNSQLLHVLSKSQFSNKSELNILFISSILFEKSKENSLSLTNFCSLYFINNFVLGNNFLSIKEKLSFK